MTIHTTATRTTRLHRTTRRLAGLGIAASVLLTACGGSDDTVRPISTAGHPATTATPVDAPTPGDHQVPGTPPRPDTPPPTDPTTGDHLVPGTPPRPDTPPPSFIDSDS